MMPSGYLLWSQTTSKLARNISKNLYICSNKTSELVSKEVLKRSSKKSGEQIIRTRQRSTGVESVWHNTWKNLLFVPMKILKLEVKQTCDNISIAEGARKKA